MFDVLIRGGTVVDGSGCPGYRADIGVVGDRVCDIGAIPPEAQAARTIDATDKVVAPGFIDIHTHADIALLARPEHLPKIMQGVTTEVFTNCGLGFAPVTEAGLDIQRKYIAGLFGDEGGDTTRPDGVRVPRVDWNWRTVADFLGRFERQGVGANIVYLVPHGALRVSAMGMEERPATAAELQVMCSLLSQALEEGAWGMSTGIWYAPMRAAEREELVTLCRLAGFFATHQRDYGDAIFAATQESLEIAQEAGVPVQIAHLQMNGAGNAGRAAELLAKLENARAVGVDVTCDTYPYTAGSTFVQSLLPAWAIDGGPDMILRRLSEPETRMRIVADLSAPLIDWSRYNLVGAESRPIIRSKGVRLQRSRRRDRCVLRSWSAQCWKRNNSAPVSSIMRRTKGMSRRSCAGPGRWSAATDCICRGRPIPGCMEPSPACWDDTSVTSAYFHWSRRSTR